jgi:hypothetical protein
MNEHGLLSLYESTNPQQPRFLWCREVPGIIRDVAVSDGGRFVAYRSDSGDSLYRHTYVLSGRDGDPVCKLKERRTEPGLGPLNFIGDYLFIGTHFSFSGATLNTEYVYLFDLSHLKSYR